MGFLTTERDTVEHVYASSFRGKLSAKLIGRSRTRTLPRRRTAHFSKLLITSTEYRVIFNLLNGAVCTVLDFILLPRGDGEIP